MAGNKYSGANVGRKKKSPADRNRSNKPVLVWEEKEVRSIREDMFDQRTKEAKAVRRLKDILIEAIGNPTPQEQIICLKAAQFTVLSEITWMEILINLNESGGTRVDPRLEESFRNTTYKLVQTLKTLGLDTRKHDLDSIQGYLEANYVIKDSDEDE